MAYNGQDMVTGKSWRFWAFLMGLALTVALFILAWAYPKFPGDDQVLHSIQGLQATQTTWLDGVARSLDLLGELPVVLGLVGGLTLILFAAGRRADALMAIAALVFMAAGQILKPVVGRARPDDLLAGAESAGFGFPSGHSVYAFLFGGLLIYFAGSLISNMWVRRIVQASICLWVVFMGTSRVYLGVHWPSDVIGGFMFGTIALAVIITLRNTLGSR
ncbi:MAG: hypothetical protein BZY80_06430 [SAR202 cluster bacterium Io17-Chloro-G2]|nr:MAG: hypothetical protein BZY80_06430 [SAR202 cluster bacterium Io17-Chloro-G2]